MNASEKQQLIQDNQYLADFKELDRSKTDAYLASQQGTPGFLSGNNTVRIGPYDVCNSDTYTTDYRNEPLISLAKDTVAIVGGASGTVLNVASNTVGLPLAVLDAGLETLDPGGHKRNAYDLWSSTNGFNGPDDALAAALKAPVIYKEATAILLILGKGEKVVDRVVDAEEAVIKTGGRLGKAETRLQNNQIAQHLETNGYEIVNGGGYAKEEYLPGIGGGRKGSNYPDITAKKDGETIRINTVDTYVNGTPTKREANAAESIQTKKPNDKLILIPKGSGLGNLEDLLK